MKLIVCMFFALISAGKSFASQTEYQTIEDVIEAFEQSIQTKDKDRFLGLFVDPAKPMIAVVTESGLRKRRALVEKYNKEQNKNLVATRTFTLTPIASIDKSTSHDKKLREEISNIKITTDDNIANVYFDYVFYIDNKKNNWGKESWQLVQTVSGWKIASVVYSVISN